ncbi:exported hypothetical protein [Candidatus Sulfotelmatobacter kueseliae]|jgi:hypothetical protein|uniref:Integrin alpha beta-propellor repeat protein n=1 Tax=Candidatus Sulfotelmatobacter kueseliae TaxID=2042962 RepID=A0A2U3JZF0_9BACT|nr:exported hypothetical protein [Candidatus Sulfotelmatobacter kueseliae]
MKKSKILSFCLFASLTCSQLWAAGSPREFPLVGTFLAELSDNPSSAEFGSSVAISGSTVVVGNEYNFVSLYVEPAGGWANMTVPTAVLTCSDANYCSSVAIDGNTVVAEGAGGSQDQNSAVYVFVKPEGGWTSMTETAKLTDTNPNVGMGRVSISGGTVAVVAETNNPPGGVDVFVEPDGGWTNMTQTATLTANSGDFFQWVAISADTVVAGSNGYLGGAVYLFVQPSHGWKNMTQTAQLSASDGVVGATVAIAGKEVLVAGENQNNESAVYLYVKPASGWANMTQTAELTEKVQQPHDSFGFSLAVQGNVVLVGAPEQAANPDQGYVYLFLEPAGGWANMTQTTRFTCTTSCGSFGVSLAINGTTGVIGAPDHGVGQALIYGK